MQDRYGVTFKKEDIVNADCVGFLELLPLDDFSEEELAQQGVLIIDPSNNTKRLYLLSELQAQLKQNHYCRLTDPFTKADILSQVPEFKAAIELEQNAAHYNAYILNKYPEFIPLLKTYVQETLNEKDSLAFLETPKDDIEANNSENLTQFYQNLADMSEEKREAFSSLFLTNRRAYSHQSPKGTLWTFSAKWEPNLDDPNELHIYRWALQNNYYKHYPHRNVRTGDFIVNPEDGCMHSWGMDVLYLLLEYHIGTNQPFSLFERVTNKASFDREQCLHQRIIGTLTPGSLDIQKGQQVFEQAKKVTLDDLSQVRINTSTPTNPPTPIDTPESDQKRIQLEEKCSNYMDYILNKMSFGRKANHPFPLPTQCHHPEEALVKKYQAVYELFSALKQQGPGINNNTRLEKFTLLCNEKTRQETITAHRDSFGIRLVNFFASILSLGIKNIITSYYNDGYCGFWNSRGAHFKEQINAVLTAPLPGI